MATWEDEALGAIPVKQRPVMYLALEDSHRRLQDRFRRILSGGAIPADISLITVATPSRALCAIAEFISPVTPQIEPLIMLDTPAARSICQAPRRWGLGGGRCGGRQVEESRRRGAGIDVADRAPHPQSGVGRLRRLGAGHTRYRRVGRLHPGAQPETPRQRCLLNIASRDVTEAEYALTADEGVLLAISTALIYASSTSNAAEHRVEAQEKMSDRLMDVFRFVDKSNDAVAATDVAKALDGLDGDTAGKYLRRLAENGYIVKVGRGQYLGKSSGVSEPDERRRSSDAMIRTLRTLRTQHTQRTRGQESNDYAIDVERGVPHEPPAAPGVGPLPRLPPSTGTARHGLQRVGV